MKHSLQKTALLATLLPTYLMAADAQKVTWDDHVFAVMEESCISCHNPDKAKGGLDLSTYNNLMKGGSSGASVTAGDPAASLLYKVMAHLEEPFMPQNKDKLPQAKIDVVKNWISGGLLETLNSKAKKAKPAVNIALAPGAVTGKPDGPAAQPEYLPLEPAVVSERPAAISAIATSNWAPVAAVAGQKQVLLYNTDTLQPTGILPFNEGFIESLKFSPNGALLVAGGGRGGKMGRAVAWDVKSGKQLLTLGQEYDTVLAADIAADHSAIAVGSPGKRIKTHDTGTGELNHNIKKHSDWITAVSYSPDGVLLATGDRNGGVYVWEAFTGNLFYTLAGHKGGITGISWRIDSNALATACTDGSVRLFAMSNGRQYRTWKAHDDILSIHFGRHGQIVTSGRDKQVKIWGQDAKNLKAFTGFEELPLEVAFSHNGKRVIVGDWNGNVTVWDAVSTEQIGTLSANPLTIAQQIAKADADLKAAKANTLKAKQTLDAVKAATAKALKTLNDAKTLVTTRTKEKADSDKALAQAKTASTNADKAKKAAIAEAANLKKAHDQLVAQIKPVEAALNTAKQGQAKWKAEITSRTTQANNLKTASDSATELSKKTPTDAVLKDAAAKTLAALQAMQKALDESKKQEATAAQQIKANTDKLTALRQKVDASTKTIQVAQSKVTAQDKAFKDAATKIAAATKAVTDKANQLKAAQAAVPKADKALKDQQAKEKAPKDASAVAIAAEQKATKNLAKWKAEQFNAQRHQVIAQLESSSSKFSELQYAFDTSKSEYDQAQAQLTNLEKEKAGIPAKNTTLQKELDSRKNTATAEAQKLGNLNRSAQEKKAFLNKFDALSKELEALAKKEPQNNELIQADKSLRENVRQQLDTALNNARAEITAQSQTVEQANSAVTQTEQQITALKTLPQELDAKIQAQAKVRDDLKAKFTKAQAEQSTLQKSRQELQTKIDKMTKDYLAMLPK